jgi:hypothetical protein
VAPERDDPDPAEYLYLFGTAVPNRYPVPRCPCRGAGAAVPRAAVPPALPAERPYGLATSRPTSSGGAGSGGPS